MWFASFFVNGRMFLLVIVSAVECTVLPIFLCRVVLLISSSCLELYVYGGISISCYDTECYFLFCQRHDLCGVMICFVMV